MSGKQAAITYKVKVNPSCPIEGSNIGARILYFESPTDREAKLTVEDRLGSSTGTLYRGAADSGDYEELDHYLGNR